MPGVVSDLPATSLRPGADGTSDWVGSTLRRARVVHSRCAHHHHASSPPPQQFRPTPSIIILLHVGGTRRRGQGRCDALSTGERAHPSHEAAPVPRCFMQAAVPAFHACPRPASQVTTVRYHGAGLAVLCCWLLVAAMLRPAPRGRVVHHSPILMKAVDDALSPLQCATRDIVIRNADNT